MLFRSTTVLGKGRAPFQYLLLFVSAVSIPALALLNAGFDNQWIQFALLFISMIMLLCLLRAQSGAMNLENKPALMYILFVLWCAASFFWSSFRMKTLIELIYLLYYGLIFIIIGSLKKEYYKYLFSIIIANGALISAIGILLFSLKIQTRVESTMANANVFGIYSVMTFLLSWGFYLKYHRRIYILPAFIIACSIMLSGSRASLIILAVTLVIMLVCSEKGRRIKAFIHTSCMGVTSYAFIVFFRMLLLSGIKDPGTISMNVIGRTGTFTTSVVDRLKFWNVAFDIFKGKPIAGTGLGTFFTEYANHYNNIGLFARYVHNHYLQLLSETGIIGLLLFIIFLLVCFVPALKRLKQICETKSSIIIYGPVCLAFLMHIGMDFSFNFPAVTALFFTAAGALTGELNEMEVVEERKVKPWQLKPAFLLIPSALLLIVFFMTGLHLFCLNYYNVCAINEKNGNTDSAQNGYIMITKLYPINPVVYDRLSYVYYTKYVDTNDREYYFKAVQYAGYAVKKAPYEWIYREHLGDIQKAGDNTADAINTYRLAAKYSLYNLEPYIELILLYQQEGNTEELLKYADYAVELFKKRRQVDVYNVYDSDYMGSAASLFRISAMVYSLNCEGKKAAMCLDEYVKIIEQYPGIEESY